MSEPIDMADEGKQEFVDDILKMLERIGTDAGDPKLVEEWQTRFIVAHDKRNSGE